MVNVHEGNDSKRSDKFIPKYGFTKRNSFLGTVVKVMRVLKIDSKTLIGDFQKIWSKNLDVTANVRYPTSNMLINEPCCTTSKSFLRMTMSHELLYL